MFQKDIPIDEMPEDIRRDMNILMGNYMPGDAEEEQQSVINALSGQGGRPGGPSQVSDGPMDFIKSGMLKKTDTITKFQKMEDPVVRVFDIADPEHQKQMELIYAALGDPRNKLCGSETPPHIQIDPNSPRGYRVIVVLKYWKITQDAVMGKMPGQ